MAETKLNVNIVDNTVQVTVVVGQAVSIHLRPEDAGKLLYVGDNGLISVLRLGTGLAIRNGMLMLTGSIPDVPVDPDIPDSDEVIAFVDNGDGTVTITGVTFAEYDNDVVLINNAELVQDGEDVVLVL